MSKENNTDDTPRDESSQGQGDRDLDRDRSSRTSGRATSAGRSNSRRKPEPKVLWDAPFVLQDLKRDYGSRDSLVFNIDIEDEVSLNNTIQHK